MQNEGTKGVCLRSSDLLLQFRDSLYISSTEWLRAQTSNLVCLLITGRTIKKCKIRGQSGRSPGHVTYTVKFWDSFIS